MLRYYIPYWDEVEVRRYGFLIRIFYIMSRKLTTHEFIKKAKQVHGEKYDYRLVEYQGYKIDVKIICKEHGVFYQRPGNHLTGQSCPVCGQIKKGLSKTNNVLKDKFEDLIQAEDYKFIPLTHGMITKVDNEDFDRLKSISWHYNFDGYAKSNTYGYMHRFIMNTPEDMLTDHINHDTLDNRKSNLRICTSQENQRNKLKREGCSSEYKGVCWDKTYNKWMSKIKFNNKTINLGRFNSDLEAAKAYDEKAKDLFGEFALTNF